MESEAENMDMSNKETSPESGDVSSSSEMDLKSKEISNTSPPTDPEKADVDKEINRQDFGARDSTQQDDAHTVSSQETQEDVPEERPPYARGTTAGTTGTTGTQGGLPPLKRKETRLAQKEAHPWQHLGITLGLPMIVLFDIIVPCIIYYTWYDKHKSTWESECREQFPGQQPCPIVRPEFDQNILGSAIASFGVGELWILIARVYRLFVHRDDCAPLLSRSRWELDATSWVYAVAMLLALIPFVVGSSLVIPKLYLYGPSFIMGFLGILMVATIDLPFFKIPIGINSQPRGTYIRPFIYYAAEDFIAVDGLQDREFRVRYNDRYKSNAMFRRFFRHLTLWWLFGVCVYIGCVSAVIWTLPFHYAFGLSLGVLFAYIAVWAAVTYAWTVYEIKREHKAYMEDRIEP